MKLYDAYTQFLSDEFKAANDDVASEMQTAEQELRQEWGQEYDVNMTLANRAIDQIGGEELINLFEQSGMGRNPIVVKAFAKIGKAISEEAGLDTQQQTGEDTATLDEEIAEIQADKAYLDKNDPRHAGLVQKMQRLMSKRYPEPAAPAGATRVF